MKLLPLICIVLGLLRNGPIAKAASDPQVVLSSEAISYFQKTGKLDTGTVVLNWYPSAAKKLRNPQKLANDINRIYFAFERMTGRRPYGGKEITITERGPFKAGLPGEQARQPQKDLPNGRMEYDDWGYSGQTISISEGATETVVRDHNKGFLTWGIAHEISHDFDDFGEYAMAQYAYDTPTVEGFANLKVLLAMDEARVPIELNGQFFSNSRQAQTFYEAAYSRYKNPSSGLNFWNTHGEKFAQNASDYITGIELERIKILGRSAFYKSLAFYHRNRRFGSGLSIKGHAQLWIALYSFMAGRNLSPFYMSDGFSMPTDLNRDIARFLQMPSQYQTEQEILKLYSMDFQNAESLVAQRAPPRFDEVKETEAEESSDLSCAALLEMVVKDL